MNLLEVEKQVLPYLIKLAESPLVQSELQATKVAILNIVEAEAARAIPFGLRTIALILRWIIKRIKGACLFMKTKFDLQKFADEEVTTADTDESSIETATVGAAEESTVTTGIVIINVQDSSGTAMEGATVSYNVNAIACTGTTDTNGQLTVEELPAGTYTFTATLDGYASDTVEVTVVAGETATGTIVLTAETTTDTSSLDSTLDSAIASAASATELSDVAEAVAEAATTIITNATSTGSVSIVEELLNEIKNTKSIWVKIRNIGEIGLVATGIAKGTSWLKDQIK